MTFVMLAVQDGQFKNKLFLKAVTTGKLFDRFFQYENKVIFYVNTSYCIRCLFVDVKATFYMLTFAFFSVW